MWRSSMARLLAGCAGLFVLLTGCVRSAPQQAAHSRASLIIEQPAVTPGSKVNVGILFVTDGQWHIYWRNPGDSGEPPRIQWQLPAGVTAGELEWPTPMRLTTSAGTDFGYEGTTVLLSSLQVPAAAQPGTISVGGELHWLVCHDICIPQRTHIEAPLRIAGSTSIDDAARGLLQAAAERLPRPLPASYRADAASLPDDFRLTVESSEPITRAEFLPSEEAQIDNGAPQELASHDGKFSLTLKKSEYLRQQPEHLKGILMLNGNAYVFDAAVHSSATHEGSRNR